MRKKGVLEKLISWNLFRGEMNLKFESERRGKDASETTIEIKPNEGQGFFITDLF